MYSEIVYISNIFKVSIQLLETMDFNDCSIFCWPPTNNTIPELGKCLQNVVNYTLNCNSKNTDGPLFKLDIDCLLARKCMCVSNNPAANDIFTVGSFLYPSSIEFSLLVGKYIEDAFRI